VWIGKAFEQRPEIGVATIAEVCEAIIERQPSVLIQNEQARAYACCIDDSAESTTSVNYDRTRLERILQRVLRTRCSVADGQLVKRAWSANPENEAAIVDQIVRDTSIEIIEIRGGRQLHDSLLTANREKELVSFARNGLYEQLGVIYPRIELVADETLLPTAFRFRINCLDTPSMLSVGHRSYFDF